MAQVKNLSEVLFKPRFKHPETSTLVKRARQEICIDETSHWYRQINPMTWIWRGVPALDVKEVMARIAASDAERTHAHLLDTVKGYRNGNWIYEWVHQGMSWQQKALDTEDKRLAGEYWLIASSLYSIAAYPHLRDDQLADQAATLANRAYEEAADKLSYELRVLEFPVQGGGNISAFLHLPATGKAPYPTVLMCGGLDSLKSDYHRLFRDYFAPRGMAMITIDMPSVGSSIRWKLTQDSSFLHQQVLAALPTVPWVDHTRVVACGFRFGASVAVRLGYLAQNQLRAVVCIEPIVHHLLSCATAQQGIPPMAMDVLASSMAQPHIADSTLRTELFHYSLKAQGLLGRRCHTPMLAAYWDNDTFSPRSEAELIVNSSSAGKLIAIGKKPSYQRFQHVLQMTCDWLQQKTS